MTSSNQSRPSNQDRVSSALDLAETKTKASDTALMVELARVVAIPAKNSFKGQLLEPDSGSSHSPITGNPSTGSSSTGNQISSNHLQSDLAFGSQISKNFNKEEPANNVLWVETLVSSSCSSCSAKATCGHSILGRWFERKRQCIPVMCRNGEAGLLAVGQWVEVGVPENILLRASLLAYLLPLFGLLLGAVFFAQFSIFGQSGGDTSAIVGAIFGLLSGVLCSRYASQRLFTADRLPRLIRSVAPPQN